MVMHEKAAQMQLLRGSSLSNVVGFHSLGRLVVEIPVIIGGTIGLYPFGEIGILQVDAYGFLCRSEPDGAFRAGCGRQHDGEWIFAVLVDVVGIVFGSDLLCVGFTGSLSSWADGTSVRLSAPAVYWAMMNGFKSLSRFFLGNVLSANVRVTVNSLPCTDFASGNRMTEEVSVSSTAPAGSSMLPRWLATYCTANALEYVAAPLCCTGTKVSSTFST